ncbi:MAG TPA: LacI family DNA-binding transcriptional regulator [Armatimonadota bacterium]|jgi:LacI family transcriptional regulator
MTTQTKLSDPITPAKNITLRDIAKRCGVGISTVSRAFVAPDSQNAQTSARILAMASEMGYDPSLHHAARRMSMMQHGKMPINQLIALFFPAQFYQTTYFNTILNGIMAGLSSRGFGLLTVDYSHPSDSFPPSLLRGDVDGAIINSSPEWFAEMNTKLHSLPTFANRPIMLVMEDTASALGVTVDKISSGAQAAKHLLDLGHRHIMYPCGYNRATRLILPVRGLYAGYLQAYAERGLSPEQYLHPVKLGSDLWHAALTPDSHARLYSLYNAGIARKNPLLRELRRHPEITAILAPNDASAIIIHQLLTLDGYRVPEDISVIGNDDTLPLYNDAWHNTLTTVKLPLRQVGITAANLMVDRITGKITTDVQRVLPTTLVVRETTAPPRAR